ncbi:MAG TPA: phenylalanine 4-monooxygenase [Ilumatobacteraceae bacterium]|nr:phenylalanine 4-monooxygenase [Ilumatobacteraceae bacterium]
MPNVQPPAVDGDPASHPSLTDPDYRRRRDEIASLAAGPGERPRHIDYLPSEDRTWRDVQAMLSPALERHACAAVLDGRRRLGLATDHVEQLDELSDRLEELTGFRYEAVAGLVPKEQFFGSLARRRFLSTQYVRHHDQPAYTPEPDVIHEVIGHATALAVPELAELHRLAGEAMLRLEAPEARQALSDVFWFSAEFGVVREDGDWKAYGTGLLSSVGELQWFRDNAEVRAVDPAAMAAQPYDISHYQPILFGAESLDQVLEVVGGFFSSMTDDVVDQLATG